MSHQPLLIALQEFIGALQTTLDALRVLEHHLLSAEGQSGAASHVLHALTGFRSVAGASLSLLGMAASGGEDAEEPTGAQPSQAGPSAGEPAAGRAVADAPRKPQRRRAEARAAPQKREVPPDAVDFHCRACDKKVFAVPSETLLLDQDGSDHALSCPMSRVLGPHEERPVKARAQRKAPGAYNPPSPPSTQAP